MSQLNIPKNYSSALSIKETQHAIKYIKDHFERQLAKQLNLTRVSAPLFVRPESGLNDNLNGVERPVKFDIKDLGGAGVEVVHSLAKWKRMALKDYGFGYGEGLYTDMTAIRRDEELDNLHSIYVDQWDWEKVILKDERNIDTLKGVVRSIFQALKDTEHYIADKYSYIEEILPEDIFKTALLYELLNHDPCADPQANAPSRLIFYFRDIFLREVLEIVLIRLHPCRVCL